MNPKSEYPECDRAYLLRTRVLPAEEKLLFLEKMNEFLREAMPESSKRKWEKLKKLGF